VAYVPLSVIRDVIGMNGKYALDLIHELSVDGMFLMERMIRINQQQVPGRVAEMLLFFCRDIYHSQQYTLPISRQEIADLVYSTKESISRTLTEFKNDRMIEIEDRKVVLQSIDLLEILCKMG
jgi:CRP-like cAMP-binding protein